MRISDKNISSIMAVIAVLWVIITVLGAMNMVEIGFYFTVALTACYGILGAAHDGNINKKILFYPILAWVVLMVISIIGMNYYQELFLGTKPAFTIFGFHPSFAFVVVCNWIGGILTWTVGFYVFRDDWLSEDYWDKFLDEIKRIDTIEDAEHE